MASELIVQNLKGPSSGSNANKILVPSGHELHAPNHIIQSVSDIDQTHQTINAADVNTDSNLSVTITPKYSDSKIHINLAVSLSYEAGANSFSLYLKRVQDGTTTYVGKGNNQSNQFGFKYVEMGSAAYQTRQMNQYCHTLVDDAGSTDAITYTFGIRIDTSAQDVLLNKCLLSDLNVGHRARGESTIICYEVKQ